MLSDPCIVAGRSDGEGTLAVPTEVCETVAISASVTWSGVASSGREVQGGAGSAIGVIDRC